MEIPATYLPMEPFNLFTASVATHGISSELVRVENFLSFPCYTVVVFTPCNRFVSTAYYDQANNQNVYFHDSSSLAESTCLTVA